MRVLLLNVPSRTIPQRFIPLGLLYAGGAIERAGHDVKIHDFYLHDLSLKRPDELHQMIEKYEPDILGFGGIASSYGKAKKLSIHLRNQYPDIFQMAGGSLASIYEYLLTKTSVDLVFHGEAELTLPIFLHQIEKKENWRGIPGTSHRSDEGILRNPPSPQIENLDTVSIPPYHLVNLQDYTDPTITYVEPLLDDLAPQHRDDILKRINGREQSIPVITSRGCTNLCSFCYRHMQGHRQHSVPYVIQHLRYLTDTYDIRAFRFSDELFNRDRKWVLDFCNAVETLDIVYTIGGARINRVDHETLQRLKETGCISINYGQESGSDTILKEYRKGVTVEQNRIFTQATHEHGITCPVQLVIGSPSETQETIRETLQFLLDVKAKSASVNYLIPFPETPIWEEAMKLIPDVESYLNEVAEHGGAPLVNLTRAPERIWRSWAFMLKSEMRLAAIKREEGWFRYVLTYPLFKVLEEVYQHLPGGVVKLLRDLRDTSV